MKSKIEYKCKHMKDCLYRRRTRLEHDLTTCDYILIEGKSRGCDAEKCDKYIKKNKENEEEVRKKYRENYYLDFKSYGSDLLSYQFYSDQIDEIYKKFNEASNYGY